MCQALLYYLAQTWTADCTGRPSGIDRPGPQARPVIFGHPRASLAPAGSRPLSSAACAPG
jgi:hypothetical protein